MSILVALHTIALSIIICTTFLGPTSIIASIMGLAMKSLFYISPNPSIDFKNISPLSMITIKFISGLL